MVAKVKIVMAPEMPDAVLIGSVVYRVTIDPDEWMRYENTSQCKGAYGHTDSMVAVIYISPYISPDNERLTLWHEIMHAICDTVIGSPHWDHLGEGPTEREERVVRTFESPIVLVLRDNPQLVAYLTAP